jgi:hypothetical protein
MNREPILRRGVLALVVFAAVPACQSPEASGPSALRDPGGASSLRGTTNTNSNLNVQSDQDGPHSVACAPSDPIVATTRLGARGGTLVVGESRLIVPAGALSDTVTITATRLGNGTSTIQLEPKGLRLQKSASLVLSGANCALPHEGSASVLNVESDGSIIDTRPADYVPSLGIVTTAIARFSGYAIAF